MLGDMSVRWRIWLEAARLRTLSAAVVPVGVATAFAQAHGRADGTEALVCLVFALLVQVGTNYANDYFDHLRGADAPDRVGPRRAVAAGLVSPVAMRTAAFLVLALAFAVGLLLVVGHGWVLLLVGLASILSAIAYTGGPYPLAYHGLGDLFVFLFFGLVAVGVTYFVQAGPPGWEVLAAAAAIGLLAANILVANNYRDVETDARAGKRTLVVRFGRRAAVWQYGGSHLAALAAAPALVAAGRGWGALLPLLLAPWAWRLTRDLAASRAPQEQIALLGASARYLAAYGLLLGLGVAFAS